MDAQSLLTALLELAESLGIEVRAAPAGMESSENPGGVLVRLKGREVLFLDQSASSADQARAAGRALAGRRELEDRYLAPEIREAINRPT